MGDSRRECILEAARALFSHYGVKKTSVADIAAKADVAVGSVYLEFDTKDDILAALVTERHRRVLEAQAEALACEAEAIECVRRALDARVRTFREVARGVHHEGELFLCARACVESAHSRFAREEEKLYADYLERVLGPTEPPASMRARALMLAYAAFAPPELFRADDPCVDAELASMHMLVLPGLVRT